MAAAVVIDAPGGSNGNSGMGVRQSLAELKIKKGDIMIDLPELEMSNIYPSTDRLKIEKGIAGIYFFYNDEFDIMYIGKSINLKTRISSHLTGCTNTRDIIKP